MADGTGNIAWSNSVGRATTAGPVSPARLLPALCRIFELSAFFLFFLLLPRESVCGLFPSPGMERVATEDCLHCVCPHLDVRTLALSRLVCRSWRDVVCAQNETEGTRGRDPGECAPTEEATPKPFTYSHASLLATARSTVPAAKKCRTKEKDGEADAVSVASARAAHADADVDPLGEDNIGRQILVKMGWKPGRGPIPEGRGVLVVVRGVCVLRDKQNSQAGGCQVSA